MPVRSMVSPVASPGHRRLESRQIGKRERAGAGEIHILVESILEAGGAAAADRNRAGARDRRSDIQNATRRFQGAVVGDIGAGGITAGQIQRAGLLR